MQKIAKIFAMLCILLVMLFAQVMNLSAQSNLKSTISGRVVDAETGEPIVNVNLFLSNTTIGTTTGNDGRYTIEKIPPGMYELVVSHIAYELKTVQIRLLEPDSLTYHFELKPRVFKGEEVEIIAQEPKDWKKILKNSKICSLAGQLIQRNVPF